jgi:hypothetical protein
MDTAYAGGNETVYSRPAVDDGGGVGSLSSKLPIVARPSGCRIETRLDAQRFKAREFPSRERTIAR